MSALIPQSDLRLSVLLSTTAHQRETEHTFSTCHVLQRSDDIKYLGFVIDQTLIFRSRMKIFVSRLRKLIYIFKNCKIYPTSTYLKRHCAVFNRILHNIKGR